MLFNQINIDYPKNDEMPVMLHVFTSKTPLLNYYRKKNQFDINFT